MSADCPGRFKCHGPDSWCDQCGDVDLVCDDPRCDVHARFAERQKARDEAFAALAKANLEQRAAQKVYDDALAAMLRWAQGNPVMVARQQTFIDAIAESELPPETKAEWAKICEAEGLLPTRRCPKCQGMMAHYRLGGWKCIRGC